MSIVAPEPATETGALADGWFWEQAAGAAAATAGADRLVVIERSARAGAMPPLHTRGTSESYRVLEGELTFFVGAQSVPAEAGDVVVAPSGSARTFRVESERARWLVLTRALAPDRFEDFTRAVARPRPGAEADWPSAEEARSLASLARPNGITLLGPPGALPAPA